MQEGPCQRHTLSHPLRVLPHRTRKIRIQTDEIDYIPASALACDSVELSEVGEILEAGHLVIKQRRMGHVADLRAYSAQVGRAQQGDRAPTGRGQARQ